MVTAGRNISEDVVANAILDVDRRDRFRVKVPGVVLGHCHVVQAVVVYSSILYYIHR